MFDVIMAVLWFIIKWTAIISWRFFSGAHMNAARYNDSTWWKDASKKFQKMRRKYTWWNRKCRMKRAAWRNAIFWPCLILSVGFAVDPWGTAFILGMLAPGLYYFMHRRFMLWFFIPVAGKHSDGETYQHWIIKPSVRTLLDKFRPDAKRRHPKHPGLLPDPEKRRKVPALEDVPLEYANAVRGEVVSELDGEPPIELKLLLDPELME